MPDQLRITYSRSAIGRVYRQRRVIKALGFKHLKQSRIIPDNPAMRGMIRKVEHLLTVEAVEREAEVQAIAPVAEPVVEEVAPEAEPVGEEAAPEAETVVEEVAPVR